jgi:hypothetical protein
VKINTSKKKRKKSIMMKIMEMRKRRNKTIK